MAALRRAMDVRLTIGLPALDEEDTVAGVIAGMLDAVRAWPGWRDEDVEVVCVNDGSTDRTGAILDQIAAREPRVRVVHHPRNLGLVGFSRSLLEHARGTYLVAISADGQVTPDMVWALVARAEEGHDVVVGCRRDRAGYSGYRRLVSWGYNRAVAALFGRDFGDAGFVKLYRTALLRDVRCISTGAFLNAERLIRLDRAGARIGRIAVAGRPRQGGRAKGASLRWVRGAAVDLARVAWDVHVRGRFARP